MHGALEELAGERQGRSPIPAGVLSNGNYTVLLTAAGTGYSAAWGRALTRFRADPVEDEDGYFLYVRDLTRGGLWSLGDRPVGRCAARHHAAAEPGRYVLTRVGDDVESTLEVCVAPDAPLEIRRLTLRNLGAGARRLEVTSYAEVVLHEPAADASHPAFSKLFVQTECAPRQGALLARRRPRGLGERHPWLVHALVGEGPVEFETDRARFLGRGRSPADPLALAGSAPLSGTTGNVLDPIVSLRGVREVPAGGAVTFVFLLGATATREEALAAIERFAPPERVDEAFAGARARELEELRRCGLGAERGAALQALAAALVYGHPALRAGRAPAEGRARGAGLPEALAQYDLSPSRPFVLCQATEPAAAACVPELLAALRYWRGRGLPLDVLVLCDNPGALPPATLTQDGCHVRRAADVPPADLGALSAAARMVIAGGWPAETAAAANGGNGGNGGSSEGPERPRRREAPGPTRLGDPAPLLFWNGHGGFREDGRAYVIRLARRGADRASAASGPGASAPLGPAGLALPPAPWINVLAGESFGALVSETGAGCTWSGNSRERRLTPWYNDPLRDPHGEAVYVRDDATGEFWSALPGPAPGAGDYEMTHGMGYSVCRHESSALALETLVFVPRRDPLKIVRVRATNRGAGTRRLSLVAYQALVLGGLPAESARFVVTSHDAESGALCATSRLDPEDRGPVAFAAAAPAAAHATADRLGFLGPHGSPASPAALRHTTPLDGRVGADLDPCFAQQVVLELAPGETVECSFLLGEGADLAEARALTARYSASGAVEAACAEVRGFWDELVGGVRVRTPAPALDLMVNGWAAYQTLACRIWGRSALYQSGGAFGYRDQLQDAAALTVLRPDLARAQLLLHAAHQFVEGDVLHWWHPPLGRGLRTRFADDLLWLPYLTADYLATTGDWAVLDEPARFLAARELAAGEDEVYLLPADSGESGDLYEHCCRALDRSLAMGRHGLPLFGGGDWNDGMNRVGREGRGESVWMGFFLRAVLGDFLPACERRGDGERTLRYRAHRERLGAALEESGWDGAWYRRGFYDDGAALGSRDSDECRIDALVQAWAVISGAAPPERAARALDEVERQLVSEKEGLIRLLTPPFENTPHDPGYIKGYLPGVRENGGQYTHAALWVVRALAEMGRRGRAARLLEMLSPVSHARTPEEVARYRVEPYVMAADVYGEAPHVGRGGWTWYTGSSGWMLRVALESVLGFRLVEGRAFSLRPRVPDDWPEFSIDYRVPGESTRYEIRVRNPHGRAGEVVEARLDGSVLAPAGGGALVPLAHDGATHRVEVILGGGSAT
jgi:cyclic beta-1,2-glucan synthetase